MRSRRYFKQIVLLGIITIISISANAQNEIKDFISKQETASKWSVDEQKDTPQTTTYILNVTSQTFEGRQWEHSVIVIIPKTIKMKNTAILMNFQGDMPKNDDLGSYIDMLSSMAGCVFIGLWNVPNGKQGLSPDANIAESLKQSIATEDFTKPMHLPMTKSIIKTMDAVDEFMKSTEKDMITKYIITGGSKNGWTCWLAAASEDKRIAGIAPIVFDFLDMNRQLQHQKEIYGDYSEKISDYTSRGIQDFVKTENGQKILSIIDPISYVDKITVPKLIINATNDSFWTFDSANIYWDKLKGDNYLIYMPNMDHGIGRNGTAIKPLDLLPIANTLINFTAKCSGNGNMVNLKWEWKEEGEKMICEVTSLDDSINIFNIRTFVAKSENKDFRKAEFIPIPGTQNEDGSFSIAIEKSKDSYQAGVTQITVKDNEISYSVYTVPVVIERL